MALSVQEILDLDIGDPTMAIRPSNAVPVRSDSTFIRPDNDSDASGPDPTGRTWDARRQLYTPVGADTPRIYGKDQGLLIEGQRTNVVSDSGNFKPTQTNWVGHDIDIITSFEGIIVDGQNAAKVKTLNNNSSARLTQNCGQFTSNIESVRVIVEQNEANNTEVGVKEANGSILALGNYDWQASDFTSKNYGAEVELYSRERRNSLVGTFGAVVELEIVYNPSDTSSSGVKREVVLYPDPAGQNNTTTFHHVQLEERKSCGTPIPSSGTKLTRGKDSLAHPSDGWENKYVGTYIIRGMLLTPRFSPDEPLINKSGTGDIFRLRRSDRSDGLTIQTNVGGGDRLSTNNTVTPYETFTALASQNGPEGDVVISLNGQGKSEYGGGYYADWANEKGLNINSSGNSSTVFFGISYRPEFFNLSQANVITS